ncbi:4-hydroxyproline epimerase [Blastomonas sp. RAC04]|uniref:4-hydroxyproline epimerase n=1 Tax=Blastomonas sp. RAC04 TaxID=1842535 RepID=UPI00083CEF59|nr:4-hydroxyproline epimerase [Blastomonas sp. RAC04]AOF99658.1 4-hydroxyproline epimerase [Blastomonas sp. RAC04]
MRHTFFCIDGHTAGNPVRLVVGGAPLVRGSSMAERRMDFVERFDWIRTGLCFEPRGHDMMSGGFLYPPTRTENDIGILFMETSGCLPMCGHGTIGIITFALEHGLIQPRVPGHIKVEVPAGDIEIDYAREGDKVTSVRIRNVASFVAAQGVQIDVPGLGPLSIDIAYGGNFYAIIEPQPGYPGLDALGAARLVELSRTIRAMLRETIEPVHPLDDRIRGVSHVLWADVPKGDGADGRNAVFYGERAIDRSPCGTGTSARLAHLAHTGRLQTGEAFVHESYIGSRFVGRVEARVDLAGHPAIIPSIEGSAFSTGFNTIWIDDEDPFWKGFSVI